MFRDIDLNELRNLSLGESLDSSTSRSNWDDVRNDTSVLPFLDSQELDSVSSFAESHDESMNASMDIQ